MSKKHINSKKISHLTNTWHQQGFIITMSNGCFDYLHVGHIKMLEYAKQQGDKLVVAINSDRYIVEHKRKKPIMELQDRIFCLSALECVDAVCVFERSELEQIIGLINPKYLIIGEDWKGKKVVGQNKIKQNNGKVLFFPIYKSFSSKFYQ